jgi:hypothetical protein
MVAPLAVVSERSIEEVRGRGEFYAFWMENPAAQVTAELLCCVTEFEFEAHSRPGRIPYYCSGIISTSMSILMKLVNSCATSLDPNIPEQLLFSLYGKYPDSSKISQVPPLRFKCYGGEGTLELSASMRILECDCEQCIQDGDPAVCSKEDSHYS